MSDAHPHLPRLHLNHGHLVEGKGKDVPVLLQVLFVSKCLTKELHPWPEESGMTACDRPGPPQHVPTFSALSICSKSTRMAPFIKLCRARWKGFASGICRAGKGVHMKDSQSCDCHVTTHPPAYPAALPWWSWGSRAGPATSTLLPLPSAAPLHSSGGTPLACTSSPARTQCDVTIITSPALGGTHPASTELLKIVVLLSHKFTTLKEQVPALGQIACQTCYDWNQQLARLKEHTLSFCHPCTHWQPGSRSNRQTTLSHSLI